MDNKYVDPIEFWNFKIDNIDDIHSDDTVRPIGRIDFWRTDDGKPKESYIGGFNPKISFHIYKLGDSTYCDRISRQVLFLSSCSDLNTGGDMIFLGSLILLNLDACVPCEGYKEEETIDLCRPLLDTLFRSLDSGKIISMKSLGSQIGLFMESG